MHHPEVLDQCELLVVDNNPGSISSRMLQDLAALVPLRYVAFNEISGTALKDMVIREARGKYVLCMDCHVMYPPGPAEEANEIVEGHHEQAGQRHIGNDGIGNDGKLFLARRELRTTVCERSASSIRSRVLTETAPKMQIMSQAALWVDIEENRVRAGLVREATEYRWSSAGWVTRGVRGRPPHHFSHGPTLTRIAHSYACAPPLASCDEGPRLLVYDAR
jgi:hypothetical protein